MGSIESIKTSETIVWCDSYPFLLVRAFLDRRNPYIFLKIYINFSPWLKSRNKQRMLAYCGLENDPFGDL